MAFAFKLGALVLVPTGPDTTAEAVVLSRTDSSEHPNRYRVRFQSTDGETFSGYFEDQLAPAPKG